MFNIFLIKKYSEKENIYYQDLIKVDMGRCDVIFYVRFRMCAAVYKGWSTRDEHDE